MSIASTGQYGMDGTGLIKHGTAWHSNSELPLADNGGQIRISLPLAL